MVDGTEEQPPKKKTINANTNGKVKLIGEDDVINIHI